MSQLLEIAPKLQRSGPAVGREGEPSWLRRLSRTPMWLLLVVLGAYFSFAFLKLGSSEVGIDEGRFGVSAINILSNPHQLATVSEDPLGQPGSKPYGYPALLAASLWALGQTEFALRTVNVISLAVGALLLYGFMVLVQSDRTLALLTVALFLLNPGTLTYARTAMPEPLVVAAGCLALFCAAKFVTKKSLPWAAACGFALGVGFLFKMWLVLVFFLACFFLLSAASRVTSPSRTLAHTGGMVALDGDLLPFQSWQPSGWSWLRSCDVVPAVVVLPRDGLQGQLLWIAVALFGYPSRSETVQRPAHRGPLIFGIACFRFFAPSSQTGELYLSSVPCVRVAVGTRLVVLGEGCIANRIVFRLSIFYRGDRILLCKERLRAARMCGPYGSERSLFRHGVCRSAVQSPCTIWRWSRCFLCSAFCGCSGRKAIG